MDKNDMGLHQKQKPSTHNALEFILSRSQIAICFFAGMMSFFILTACAPAVAPQDTTESEFEALLGMGVPVPVSTITVNIPGSDMFVAIGDTLQLTAEVYPEQEIQPELSWSIETGPAEIEQETGRVTIKGYGKILVVAGIADGSAAFGDTTLVGVPVAPMYTIDYVRAQTLEPVPATHEYSMDGGSSWVKGSGSQIRLISDQQILFRVAAAGPVYAGKAQTLIVTRPKTPAAPNFSIDYFNNQTNQKITAAYEYSSDGINWSPGDSNRVKLVNGQELQFRVVESGLIPPGQIQVLKFVKLPEHYFKMSGGVVVDYDPTGGKDVIIPSEINGVKVTGIGNKAFYNKKLTSVVIPPTVTSIGDSAFLYDYLTSVTIPSSVKTIGGNAFCYNKLTSVVIPDSVASIGEFAFSTNPITALTLGKGMQRIGAHAFSDTSISQVTIPDSVTDIGSGAFSGLSQDKITLGKGYNSHFVAEGNTILGMICSPNVNLVIPSTCNGKTVTSIGYSAFWGKGLQSVTFPATLKEIGSSAFEQNRLSSVVFVEGLEVIGYNAFSNNMLTSLNMPASLKLIDQGAFLQPNSITKIIMKGSDASVSLFVLTPDSTSFELYYLTYGKGTYTADSQVSRKWTYSSKVN